MDDKRIIALFFERSEQAITETKTKYGTVIRRTAFHILHDYRDTEECENDTYLAVWNRIPPEKPDPLAAYLCRISRNLALKRYEYNTAKRRNNTYDAVLDELSEIVGTSHDDPVKAFERKELTRAIEAFLDTLGYDDRILFVRRYWYAYSVKELSILTQKSPHLISVKLSRIRKRLQKYLWKEGLLS